MSIEEMAEAIRTCSTVELDAIARALWAAHAAGQVTDDEAESLSVVIEARRNPAQVSTHFVGTQRDAKRRAVPSPSAEEGFTISSQNLPAGQVRPETPFGSGNLGIPQIAGSAGFPGIGFTVGFSDSEVLARSGGYPNAKRTAFPPCPKRAEARERARRWAAAGRMPPAIAAKFTPGEQAALAVIAFEFAKRQFCDKSIGELATVAGVSQSTVKRALRQARFLGLLTVQERRLSRYRNETNIVRIIGKAWLAWLDLRGKGGGVQRRPGTSTSGLREEESGSVGRAKREIGNARRQHLGLRADDSRADHASGSRIREERVAVKSHRQGGKKRKTQN